MPLANMSNISNMFNMGVNVVNMWSRVCVRDVHLVPATSSSSQVRSSSLSLMALVGRKAFGLPGCVKAQW